VLSLRRLEAWPRAVDVSLPPNQADPLIRELDRSGAELTDQRIAGTAGRAGHPSGDGAPYQVKT
jgi:hypothetical protein